MISLDALREDSPDHLSSQNLEVRGFWSSSAMRSIWRVSVTSMEERMRDSGSFRLRGAGEMALESSVMLLRREFFLGESDSI